MEHIYQTALQVSALAQAAGSQTEVWSVREGWEYSFATQMALAILCLQISPLLQPSIASSTPCPSAVDKGIVDMG